MFIYIPKRVQSSLEFLYGRSFLPRDFVAVLAVHGEQGPALPVQFGAPLPREKFDSVENVRRALIDAREPVTVHDLAYKLQVTKQTIVRCLEILERERCVERGFGSRAKQGKRPYTYRIVPVGTARQLALEDDAWLVAYEAQEAMREKDPKRVGMSHVAIAHEIGRKSPVVFSALNRVLLAHGYVQTVPNAAPLAKWRLTDKEPISLYEAAPQAVEPEPAKVDPVDVEHGARCARFVKLEGREPDAEERLELLLQSQAKILNGDEYDSTIP